MSEYYNRSTATHVDGTPIFTTAEDAAHEDAIAGLVARAWGCEMHRFGLLSPVDWYAVRQGRVVGIAELKYRSHNSGKFPTVFLNVRKWLALLLGGVGLGVPGIFIVRFTDCVRWCDVAKVDAGVHRIAGCNRRVKSTSDIEPLIEVSVGAMRVLVAESLNRIPAEVEDAPKTRREASGGTNGGEV